MKILSKYILREYLANVGLGLVIFTFVLLLDHLFELVDLLINKGTSPWLTVKLLTLLLPSTITLTLPMSCLLAALLTFGRLSETNEVTAIRASGLSAWSYLKTPYIAAGLASLFLFPFNSLWAPHAHAQFRQLYLEILGQNPLVRIEERTFTEIGDYHFYVQHKVKRSSRMEGVSIYRTPVDGPPLRIYAEEGTARVDPQSGVTFILERGHLAKVDPSVPNRWVHSAFGTYVLTIPVATDTKASDKSLEEMDYFELRQRIAELRKKQIPFPILECQIHLRLALAITPLLFVMLGIPLAIRVHRGGRSIGFAISLGVLVVYYVILMGGTGLGQRGVWPPLLAVWLANAILLFTGMTLTWRFLQR